MSPWTHMSTLCTCGAVAVAEYRFNNQTLAMGYQRNLLWTCSLIDYLKESDKYHWTIVGEFTREWLHSGMPVQAEGSSRQYRLREVA